MEDPYTFWTKHLPHEATDIVRRHLGKALLRTYGDVYTNLHHFWRFGYTNDFDLSRVEKHIRADLDRIGWLFLTTGESVEKRNGETLPTFGAAPILPRTLTVGYHATRACVIPRILDEGLLPSNAERQTTDYPDTEGVIHVCAKLKHEGSENDSAEWWRDELAKKNRFNDPDWGILHIDMARLPATARTYQDMHSQTGVIVDRIDRIPAKLITEVSR